MPLWQRKAHPHNQDAQNMAHRDFEAARLDISTLGNATSLSIHTIRKSEWKRLRGLDGLDLESLSLRWLSAPDLTVVPMPPKLRSLTVWHSNKLKSLNGVEQAADLEEVDLRENGQPLSLAALAGLTKLKVLRIQGGYGAGQRLTDLDGIEGLPIETLEMQAIDGTNLDLGPIARLPKLKALDIPPQCFARNELARIAASHPWYDPADWSPQP
ncbi:MAG: hypothetical protein AAGF30_09490 [Pseudomonadota bacterium]